MNITLEQSLASCVRYILDNDVEGSKAYFDEIPEKFYVPSVYFPVPYVEGRKATLGSYKNTITFDAWVMAGTDWDAEARAASLRDAIMLDDMAIPIISADGKKTGKALKAQEPTQRRIDEGIVCVSIPVREYFTKDETHTQAKSVVLAWKKIKETYGE